MRRISGSNTTSVGWCAALVVTTALAAFPVGCGGRHDAATVDEMLLLYQDSCYKQAKKAAAEHGDDPRGQLVYHLCEMFDTNDQNVEAGLDGLGKLYEDPELREKQPLVWAEAGLSYARVIQVDQLRAKAEGRSQLPRKYAAVDVREILTDIMTRVPESAQGAMAVIYLAESCFRTDDQAQHDAGFEMVEKYLSEQKPDAGHVVPVHLYVEVQYINQRGDYKKSYEHLRQAYETGIVKEILRRLVLFRLGRVCDTKLNRKQEAKTYYEKFLEDYPYAQRTPLVKRYLKELERK